MPEGVHVRDTHFEDASRANGENYTTGNIDLTWDSYDVFRHAGPGADQIADNATPIPGIPTPDGPASNIDRGAFPISKVEQ